MNAITRHLTTLVATLALAATAAGCANTPTATPTADTADSQATLDAINNASEITATKSLLSWGDEWVIEADGNKVGTVTGQALYTIGDVYSLTTTSGNLVASETEELSTITHTATLYDWGNQPTGTLEERFLALTPTVDIHTTPTRTAATTSRGQRQPFSLPSHTRPPSPTTPEPSHGKPSAPCSPYIRPSPSRETTQAAPSPALTPSSSLS